MSQVGACLWQMRPGKASATPRTLLLLPHAGGSAQGFASWAEWFPEDLRILAAQYPARASRAREPAATDLHHIVDEIVDALADLTGLLYVFGHSMGSYVGFELCWRRQLAGSPPAALFASAAVPPDRHRPDSVFGADLSDERLLEFMDTCDGVLDELRNHPDLMTRALHTLRADVVLFNNYSYGARRRRLRIPIVALGGDRDELAPAAELDRWHDLSATECATHLFSGGHFYYFDNMATCTATVSKYLTSVHDEQTE